MSLRALEANQVAWRSLEDAWAAAQERWHDAATDHFERRFWAPLEQDMAALQQALEELDAAIEDARAILYTR